jgi:heme exporter protein D
MNWASWADFFAMGGYAFYVCGSFGLTAIILIAEVILVDQRKRTILRRLGRIHRKQSGVSKNET